MTSDVARHEAGLFAAAALPAAVATLVVAAVAATQAGVDGIIGSVLGGLLVIAFFGFDHLLSARTRRRTPVAVSGLAIAGYVVKLLLLAVVLAVFRDTTLFSDTALAVSVVVVTAVWTAGAVRAFARRRLLYVEPAAEAEGGRR